MAGEKQALVLFDAACGVCCRSVRFIMDRDRRHLFRFEALGSGAADVVLRRNGLRPRPDTLVLEDAGRLYTYSTAVLRVFRGLGLPWSLLYAFIIVPRPLRDAAYRFVARNRGRFGGAACGPPGPATGDP